VLVQRYSKFGGSMTGDGRGEIEGGAASQKAHRFSGANPHALLNGRAWQKGGNWQATALNLPPFFYACSTLLLNYTHGEFQPSFQSMTVTHCHSAHLSLAMMNHPPAAAAAADDDAARSFLVGWLTCHPLTIILLQ
jgi:hypothetical protein